MEISKVWAKLMLIICKYSKHFKVTRMNDRSLRIPEKQLNPFSVCWIADVQNTTNIRTFEIYDLHKHVLGLMQKFMSLPLLPCVVICRSCIFKLVETLCLRFDNEHFVAGNCNSTKSDNGTYTRACISRDSALSDAKRPLVIVDKMWHRKLKRCSARFCYPSVKRVRRRCQTSPSYSPIILCRNCFPHKWALERLHQHATHTTLQLHFY